MFNLLRFEYRKLFFRKSFIICLILLFLPLMLITMEIIGAFRESGSTTSPYTIMEMMTAFSNVSVLVLIFTAIFVCEDYMQGTAKVIFSKGYTRTQIFFAKFLASASAAAIFFGIVTLFGLIVGAIYGNDAMSHTDQFYFSAASKRPELWVYVLHQFTQIMALHALYYMMAECFRRTGLSIVMNFFFPGMVTAFLFIIQGILLGIFKDNTEFCNKIRDVYNTVYPYLLPSGIMSGLGAFVGDYLPDYTVGMIVNCGYVVLFGGLAWLLVAKKQITN